MNLQQRIADLTAKHEADLAARIAELKKEAALGALCPEGFAPESFSYAAYCDVDTIHFEVSSAKELRELVVAWHEKYGAFRTIGEYRGGCTTITAHPWAEYATVEPERVCDDGVKVSNHAGRGFDSLTLYFYPNVPDHRVKVSVSEAFRASIPGFHGYVSASYDSHGDPIYDSIRNVEPSAFRGAAFTVRYGSGSEDSTHFCGVFSFGQLLTALPVEV